MEWPLVKAHTDEKRVGAQAKQKDQISAKLTAHLQKLYGGFSCLRE